MKKNIIALFLIIFLSSCFWNKNENQSVEDIKQGLLQQTGTTIEETSTGVIEISTGSITDDTLETKGYKIEYVTEEKFIELDSLDSKVLEYGEIEITGKTLEKVDKIEVNFSNKDSNFPVDNFELKKFKSGDETFKYYASSKYKVLDYGENIYEFIAYSGDKVSTLKLTILIKNKEAEINNTEKQENISINEENKISNQNSSTGTTTSSGTTCETLNDYLSENMTTWYYWNTCRPTNNGIGFYLVRLDGKNYIYEKYNISSTGEVNIKELEKGSSNEDTKDTIETRNDELKLRNSEFEAKIK